MDVSPTLEAINKAWKITSKTLLGDEIGDIWKYENYLKQCVHLPIQINDIYFPGGRYNKVKNVIKFNNDTNLGKPFGNIDEIKDIDNLFDLAREHFEYIGDVVLGNSSHVEKSANVINSFYVYKSNTVMKSKYIAYSSYIKDVEYAFGTHALGSMKFTIGTNASGGGEPITRVFESFYVLGGTTDVYFSHNLVGCSETFFSFFQKGKRYMIGNNELPKEKYLKIKSGLLEQIRADMKQKKLKTIYDLIKSTKIKYKIKIIPLSESPHEKVKSSFASVSKTLFGRSLNLEEKSIIRFLTRNLPYYHIDKINVDNYIDTVGGFNYYLGEINRDLINHYIPTQLIDELSHVKIDIKILNGQSSLKDIMDAVARSGLAMINISLNIHNIENVESAPCIHSAYLYRVVDGIMAKTSAYSLWPRQSTNTYGSFSVFESHFAIRSYGSENVMRVFEADASNRISDSYYVHMCEGISNTLFSYGLKGGHRDAYIMNRPVDLRTYQKVRDNLKDWILSRIEEKKVVPHVFELQSGWK